MFYSSNTVERLLQQSATVYCTPELTSAKRQERGDQTICYTPMVSPVCGPLYCVTKNLILCLKKMQHWDIKIYSYNPSHYLSQAIHFPSSSPLPLTPALFCALNDVLRSTGNTQDPDAGFQPSAFRGCTSVCNIGLSVSPRRVLIIMQRFGRNFSCHLQDECIIIWDLWKPSVWWAIGEELHLMVLIGGVRRRAAIPLPSSELNPEIRDTYPRNADNYRQCYMASQQKNRNEYQKHEMCNLRNQYHQQKRRELQIKMEGEGGSIQYFSLEKQKK